MGHFKSNLRDTEFTLFEVLGVGERLGQGPFAEVDEETARGILAEVERLASGPVAESLLDSDRNPPVFDPQTHTATLPESFKKSFKAYMDAEWWRMQLPEELGRDGRARLAALGRGGDDPRREPGGAHVRVGHVVRPPAVPAGHAGPAEVGAAGSWRSGGAPPWC